MAYSDSAIVSATEKTSERLGYTFRDKQSKVMLRLLECFVVLYTTLTLLLLPLYSYPPTPALLLLPSYFCLPTPALLSLPSYPCPPTPTLLLLSCYFCPPTPALLLLPFYSYPPIPILLLPCDPTVRET